MTLKDERDYVKKNVQTSILWYSWNIQLHTLCRNCNKCAFKVIFNSQNNNRYNGNNSETSIEEFFVTISLKLGSLQEV